MKWNKQDSFGIVKTLLLAGSLATVGVHAASAPTNSWNEWQYKKLSCGFTSALLVSLNGHTLPVFATNLFPEHPHMYLYADVAGDVFGVGDFSMQTSNRAAVFNMEAKGTLSTKGSKPNLAFTLSGEGYGLVADEPGSARLEGKFIQTRFVIISNGMFLPETYYAEGRITGSVMQPGANPLRFSDTLRIRLDNIPGHLGDSGVSSQLRLDLVDIDGHKFAGHTHGTNNCFGRYDGDPADELIANGTYQEKNGCLTLSIRGLGQGADSIKCTVTGKLGSAPSGSLIHISNVVLKGKAYGQKPVWYGNGIVYGSQP